MTPEFWRWSAHGQWHPVVRAHPLTGLTFRAAITAPGPPIQTRTPTRRAQWASLFAHKGNPLWTLFIPLSPSPPSAPGPILLLILTRSLEKFSAIACSHINAMVMTTGQVLAACCGRGGLGMQLMWASDSLCFSEWLYVDLPTAASHLHDCTFLTQ